MIHDTGSTTLPPFLPLLMPTVTLKSGRDKSVRQRHPRLFSGALKSIDKARGAEQPVRDGDIVDVQDNKGEWLAQGVLNRLSPIAVRLLSWHRNEVIDDAFWGRRIEQALARRAADPTLTHTDARRLVFGESDGLPGLIVDDYAGHLVAEFGALCAINAREPLLAALRPHARTLTVRYDDERLKPEYGNNTRLVASLQAAQLGDTPPAEVVIQEAGLQCLVQPAGGQKTGFYLDQRDNRRRVAAYCNGARVLNTFSFTGAFALHAVKAGAAHVRNVDSSQDALALAARNAELNGCADRVSAHCADVFDDLRARRTAGESYDVVILDPPKFAHNPDQIERAARAYKDLNRLGLSLVAPGGILATFSCSGVIDAGLFQDIVMNAAVESGREGRIVERLSQASDHPVLLTFPESEYLKGLIVRVL